MPPTAPSATRWKNRIVGKGEEQPEQLLANPLNFRIHPKHQQEALGGALAEIGWVQNIVVNKRTGHIIDGHLRVTLAMREGEQAVPVLYVDLSEDEERMALAALDPISAMAGQDDEALGALLEGLEAENKQMQDFLEGMNPVPPAPPQEPKQVSFQASNGTDVECPNCHTRFVLEK